MGPRIETAAQRRARFEATALPLLGAVHATARRLAYGTSEDPADLAQETFLRAYRTFDNFTPGTNCRSWLLTILYSVYINRYHRSRREPQLEEPAEIERRFEQSTRTWAGAVESQLIAKLDGAAVEVRRAVADLPESYRSTLLLIDVEELTYEEAASILGCPVGTVRSRLSRARKLLFVALADFAGRTSRVSKEPT